MSTRTSYRALSESDKTKIRDAQDRLTKTVNALATALRRLRADLATARTKAHTDTTRAVLAHRFDQVDRIAADLVATEKRVAKAIAVTEKNLAPYKAELSQIADYIDGIR